MTDRIDNRWDESRAKEMSEAELLLYRSNLLGSDLRITNYGGGNTSAKILERDPLTGEKVKVLWVKGSGGDLGSMKLDGFATLYLEKLESLKELYRGLEFEDEMVGYLPHCTFNLNPRAASIDTPLHSFIPYRHVDHMHPDAVIAIAATASSQRLTEEVWGGRLGWLPWQRPGFDLGLKIGELAESNPQLEGIVLAGHGLFTWADTAKECYERTLGVISTASEWLETHASTPVFGGPRFSRPLASDRRAETAARLATAIRGRISAEGRKIGHFNDSAEVLEFVSSSDVERLAALGTSCPDHFLRTKIRPLLLDFNPEADDLNAEVRRVESTLDRALTAYRDDYASYYARNRHPDSPAMRDANPVVFLIPGVGMLTFAKDKATARIAGEFYVNAINVMRGAESVDTYVALPEREAFDIEYWLLEEAKLQRMPKPKPMAGRVAFITGGAGGIGRAAADAMLAEGACVVLADIDAEGLEEVASELAANHPPDNLTTLLCDVTSEASVTDAIAHAALCFGGLDVVVSNAGIASSAPLEETSLELWNRNIDILTTGYFLVTREAFKLMKDQGTGGAIVFVASKNALVASAGAAAYCTAKGAELQLARSVALEGAPHGIRCNVVNPDAVLQGSKIWSGDWKKERAAAYGKAVGDLEEHYRQRSLLKLSVLPEDVARAILFFASEEASKSTGNIVNVDAGHAPAFTR